MLCIAIDNKGQTDSGKMVAFHDASPVYAGDEINWTGDELPIWLKPKDAVAAVSEKKAAEPKNLKDVHKQSAKITLSSDV